MRKTPLSRALIAALGGAFVLSAAVQAQDAPPQKKTTDLDNVVVTARSGVETRTKAETSYSITTIDEDRLRMQAPTSVTEAVKSVPGFWVESSGGEASC